MKVTTWDKTITYVQNFTGKPNSELLVVPLAVLSSVTLKELLNDAGRISTDQELLETDNENAREAWFMIRKEYDFRQRR